MWDGLGGVEKGWSWAKEGKRLPPARACAHIHPQHMYNHSFTHERTHTRMQPYLAVGSSKLLAPFIVYRYVAPTLVGRG